jgi:WD40 repeat protein
MIISIAMIGLLFSLVLIGSIIWVCLLALRWKIDPHTVVLINAKDGSIEHRLIFDGAPACAGFSQDRRLLAVMTDDGRLELRQLPQGKLLRTVKTRMRNWRWGGNLRFSPDCKFLEADNFQAGVGLWKVQDLHELRIPAAGAGPPVTWSPYGNMLVVTVNTDEDIGSVKFIRTEDLRIIRTLVPGEGHIEQVDFSPNGRFLAVNYSGSDNRTVIWRLMDWRLIKTFPTHKEPGGFAFSPNGAMLAMAGNDLKLLDGSTLMPIKTLKGYSIHNRSRVYRHIQFSPDGTLLACDYAPDSGPDAGHPKVRIWSVTGKDPICTLDGGPAWSVSPFVFLPDNRLLVMAEGRNRSTFNCWQFPGRKLLYGTSEIDIPQRYMAASPDGRLIAIGPAILGD